MARRDDARGMSEALAIAVSAVVGIVVAVASVWYFSGPFDASFETLYRINPVENGQAAGVGADYVAGNTDPLLDALIVAIHAVDIMAGLFILVLVFIHWGAFRRLGARMRDPDEPAEVATDGGRDADSGGESA
jgi:hypothetical protein